MDSERYPVMRWRSDGLLPRPHRPASDQPGHAPAPASGLSRTNRRPCRGLHSGDWIRFRYESAVLHSSRYPDSRARTTSTAPGNGVRKNQPRPDGADRGIRGIDSPGRRQRRYRGDDLDIVQHPQCGRGAERDAAGPPAGLDSCCSSNTVSRQTKQCENGSIGSPRSGNGSPADAISTAQSRNWRNAPDFAWRVSRRATCKVRSQ